MSRTKRQAPQSHLSDQLELLWNDLLSRQPERVRSAFYNLDLPGRKTVRAHLQRMASEAGWQPEQRLSAQVALQALEDPSHQDER